MLLTEILPRVWDATLPGGLRQADSFRGWPGRLWQSAVFAYQYRMLLAAGVGVVVMIGLPIASRSRAFLLIFRLLAFVLVLADFAILAGMMAASVITTGLG